MIQSNQKSEKGIKSVIRKTATWKNFLKLFSSVIIACAITLAGVKIPAKADDYYLRWYTSQENPLSISYQGATLVQSTIDQYYIDTLNESSYCDWLVTYELQYNISGMATNGYTFLYMPYSWLEGTLPSTFPINGFTLDGIFVDSFEYYGNCSDVQLLEHNTSSLARYRRPFCIKFYWTWYASPLAGQVKVLVRFRIRAYCSDANNVNLSTLGSSNLTLNIGQYGNTAIINQAGAYIANFVPLEIDLGQYQQFLIANNYLDSIATAISPSAPPDPAVSEAETAASEAAELLDQEDQAFESFSSDYDSDEIDDVLEEIDPLNLDGNLATGLVFWKDFLNHHFNKGYSDGEHYSTTLNMVLNMIARLWH